MGRIIYCLEDRTNKEGLFEDERKLPFSLTNLALSIESEVGHSEQFWLVVAKKEVVTN